MPGRVLIVGGGICGLTLGIALRQKGFPVDLVELRPDLRQQSGIGLSLQGNSVAALARIGVAERCVRSGVPANHIDLLRADGALVAHQPLIPMGGADFPGTVGISRNELHAILLDAAETAGVAIRTAVSVDSFSAEPTGVSVRFTDGRDGSYDLMVAADGAYSGIRAKLFPHIKPTFCGQAVWRAGVPRPKETVTTELYVGGPFGIVGICPISADEAYIYVVESAEGSTRHPEADLAALMIEKLAPYSAGRIRECAAHLPGSVGISYRPLDWLLLPPPWNRDRVVVIGDAAHCNPPVLAQGAAMGIEDAVVLAESLADEPTIELALEQFTRRRVPRASLVVNNSVQLCEWEVKHLVSPKEIGRLMTETQQALAQPF